MEDLQKTKEYDLDGDAKGKISLHYKKLENIMFVAIPKFSWKYGSKGFVAINVDESFKPKLSMPSIAAIEANNASFACIVDFDKDGKLNFKLFNKFDKGTKLHFTGLMYNYFI